MSENRHLPALRRPGARTREQAPGSDGVTAAPPGLRVAVDERDLT
jgi:hypothetical protein